MKELYIAPEMKILCFAPLKSIASNTNDELKTSIVEDSDTKFWEENIGGGDGNL